MSYFTEQHLVQIKHYPHLLGHMVGFDKLGVLHSEWIKYCWDSQEDRSLQAHRDSFKTTSVIIIGAIRWMLFFYNDRIGIIRNSFTDASKILKSIREIMEMDVIKDLFRFAHGFYPELIESNARRLRYNFKQSITPEANINAFGLNSNIIGTHLDKPICDDFVTLEDRVSKTKREKKKVIIQDIRANIADQGNWKSTTFIGTPWHKQDAWTVCPDPIKFDVYEAKVLTDEQIEDRQKKLTPALFSINYRLINEADEKMLYHDPAYDNWQFTYTDVWGHVDAAFDGTATNALTFMSEVKDGYQAVGFSDPGNVKNWFDFIEVKYKRYRCRGIYIEDNADKGYTASELKKRGLNVISYHEEMNKDTKISVFIYSIWQSLTFANGSEPEYMEQIVDWCPGSEPNDAPDSLASLIRMRFAKNVFDIYPEALCKP